MYTLIGSLTSPYVRRFRIYLHGVEYKLECVNYLDAVDDEKLSLLNPIKKIPVLIYGDQPIWESRVIFSFLQKELNRAPLALEAENDVSAIDAWQDQLIQLFLMQRNNIQFSSDNPYSLRNQDRQKRIMDYLDKRISDQCFARWDYPAIALYCLIDWAMFRNCLNKEALPLSLQKFHREHQNRPEIISTMPK